MKQQNKTAIIIPALNEEKLISDNLARLTAIAGPDDIYVVDDGSTDRTEHIVREAGCHILKLRSNQGKARALNRGISHFRLHERYKYIFPLDADTVVSESFLEEIASCFKKQKEKPSAVVGRVRGRNKNWITLYRVWEYEMGQAVHKSAQSIIGGISVCSGCSTVYRSDIFAQYKIPEDTLTEDMDMTFLLHRKKAGRIVYCPEAYVETQDPDTVRDFIRQCKRWYTGFWQCISKYDLPWQGKPLDFEIALLATDGLLSSVITLMFLLFSPLLVLYSPVILILIFSFDMMFFMLPSVLFTSVRNKTLVFFRLIPHFYFLRIVSSVIFLQSFFRYVSSLDIGFSWTKIHRYELNPV